MSFVTKLKAGWKQVMRSTNGTINVITAFIMALAAAVNFPEEPLMGLIAAVVPLLATVREWLKGGVQFRFNGNVLTYLFAALVLIAPWLADLTQALQPLVEALLSGNWSAVLAALLPVLNILMYIFREKPWTKPEEPNPHEPVPDGPEPDEELRTRRLR